MPVFWFALMMQLAFAVHGIPLPGGYQIQLPSAGIASSDTFDLGDRIVHLILPAIVLSLLGIATYSRFMRSSLLEVLGTDYMRTAAAKGLAFPRDSLQARLEECADSGGHGHRAVAARAARRSHLHRDDLRVARHGQALHQCALPERLALLMGYLLLVAFFVVFSNLLADVLYAWLDPRVKYD